MILWFILIIIAIIVLALLWWFNVSSLQPSSPSSPNLATDSSISPPTVHARCNSSSSCGGDLVCDSHCHRCKKKLNGDCATDVDCESGLHCHNWKCVPNPPHILIDPSSSQPKKRTLKTVTWNDDLNETFYI